MSAQNRFSMQPPSETRRRGWRRHVQNYRILHTMDWQNFGRIETIRGAKLCSDSPVRQIKNKEMLNHV